MDNELYYVLDHPLEPAAVFLSSFFLSRSEETSCAIIGKLAQLTMCSRRKLRTYIHYIGIEFQKCLTAPKLVPHLDRTTIEHLTSNEVTYWDTAESAGKNRQIY